MALVPKIDPNKIFASNAPAQDKPAAFDNYEKGMDETRKNNGRPTIKQLNYLHQIADHKFLWIHQNGGGLPYDASIEYAENAVTLKDGELKQLVGGAWVEVKTKSLPATSITTSSSQNQQQINDFGGAKWYAKAGGYELGATVKLENGDIVKSTVPNNTANPNVDMTGWVLESSKSVSNPSDLATLQNPKNKQRVYVESLQKTFIYDVNLTIPENGVTIVGKWELETQDAYYASWFCSAESGVDESVKLQTGYDYAVSKKRAFIVDIKVDVNPTNTTKTGLWIRSNSVLGRVGDGEIRMLPNAADNYDVIRVQDVENYIIKNPVLRGDRRTHTGTSGEWGYGLTVYQSKNGYIHRPRIFDCWGDGLYIGRQWGLINSTTPTNVTVFEPYIEGTRRNGLSFTAGDTVNVIRPYITKVGDYDGIVGAFPKAAIDVEPEQLEGTPLSSIVNSRIVSPTIKDCYAGVYLYFFSDNLDHSLVFEGDTIIDGATTTPLGFFHGGSNCKGMVSFDHILIKPPHFVGLAHGWNGSSNLKCVVNKLTFTTNQSISFLHTLNGAFVEKWLGGLTIKNISTPASILQVKDSITDGYKLGNIFRKDQDSVGNLGFYGESTATYTPDFVLGGNQIHSDFSASTKLYANTIWQNPSIDTSGTTAIYLDSSSDYRRLKIGLLNTTSTIGQGCNIQGLNLLVGGVTKARAHCQTLGGWLEFQNVEGGRTHIFDSYGVWTFS